MIVKASQRKLCKIDGCENAGILNIKGFCRSHYDKKQKTRKFTHYQIKDYVSVALQYSKGIEVIKIAEQNSIPVDRVYWMVTFLRKKGVIIEREK